MPVHDRVREEMRTVLVETEDLPWLDATAREVLAAARRQYGQLNLAQTTLIAEGRTVYLFPWRGDATQDALAFLLKAHGLTAKNDGICMTIHGSTETRVGDALAEIAAAPLPDPVDILRRQDIRTPEKWDWVLSDRLFFASYASRRLNLAAARDWALQFS